MNRILFLDYVRAMALFLVVFAHLYRADSEVKLYIYAFHMPLFFFVSGYLHKDAAYKPLLKKMAQRMLVPFCFFFLIAYLYQVVSTRSLALHYLIGSVIHVVIGKKIIINEILWFLLALFHVRIMGNFLIRNPRKACVPLAVLTLAFYFSHANFFYLGSALMALPFYLAGYYGKNVVNWAVGSRYCVFLSLAFLLATVVLTGINGKVSMMGRIYGNTPYGWLNILLFYANGLIGTMMLICLSQLFKKERRWVTAISLSAITIVGLQFIPMLWWFHFVGYNQPFVFSFLYSVLIVVACVFIHSFLEKHAKWAVGNK